MDKAFRVLFNLRSGEGTKITLFILLGFLWSSSAYGVFTLSEGMFLESIGAQGLPVTYVLVALALCGLSTLLLFGLRRFSIKKLLSLLVLFWSVLTFGCALLFPYIHEHSLFWYAVKVIGWTMPISIYICYWSFIDQYVDLQDAKRLFCLINSVTFLGDACGAGLISFAMHYLGFQGLMFLYASILLMALPAIYLITRYLKPLLEEHHDHGERGVVLEFREVIKKVVRSPFTLYLLGFYFAMQLLAVVTEFNYMSYFDRLFSSSSEHHLVEFLGSCNMWIALGNMLVGVFAYSRLVRSVGVQNLVVIAPAFFFALFCLLFWKEGLSLAILGLVGREGMVYTFDDNNLNLLISGVPTKIKNQIRIAVESFFEPFGLLCGAALLFFLHRQTLYLGLLMAVIACVIVFLLRQQYPKAIFNNLVASSIRFDKTALDWIPKKEKKTFEYHLLSSLKSTDEPTRLLAFEYLLKMGNKRHLPRLLNQINVLGMPGKLKAIELLADSDWAIETSVVEQLERWRRVLPHPSVKSAIHFYFARHSLSRPEKMMQDLHHDHLGLRAAAILSFKTTPYQGQLPSLVSLASEKLQQLLESKIDNEICVGLEILGREKTTANMSQLLPYLQYPSKRVNKEAIRAISRIASPACSAYSSQLVQYLATHRDAEMCCLTLKALEKISDCSILKDLILATVHFRPNERQIVQKIVLNMPGVCETTLLELLQNRFIHERCRLMAGKILSRLNPATLKRHLFEIVQSEIERAYFYYYHLETLRHPTHSEYDHSILLNALETGYHTVIDFVIQLIGAADALEECDVLTHGLRSRNKKLRAQAIEMLQKACSSKLFALLEPLIDERSSEKKLNHYLKRGFIPLKLTQLLDTMAFSPSLTDQIVAVWLKAKLDLPDWKELVRKKMQDREEIFHHFATELLEEKL
ncbi:MAG: MFS transporter [Verrucomicrobia bacterium]|nr:MFS transporter [Verrucomicrobiota bacterium]MBS0647068.1 MFS transporter [Verrucomicrobiota bacterium]